LIKALVKPNGLFEVLFAEDVAVSSDGSRFKGFALAHNVGSGMEVDLNSVSSFFSSLFKEFTIGRSAKLLIKQK